MKKIFRKIFTILPILSALFLCSAKDIHDSFSRYYVVVAVNDTTSLNTSYEKPIVRMLRNAGHTVRLAYGDSLTKDNAIGTQDWDTFDLAVIPNFVSCPAVDTTKKIGEVPVIILEDSLWDDFGFMPDLSSVEPNLWIADYANKRIVKTQWDGVSWSSFSTGNRLPKNISYYENSYLVPDTSIYYLSFYRSSPACDTLFRTTWNFGSVSTFGKTGTLANQFNNPQQVHPFQISGVDYVAIADSGNNRYTRIKWQSTDSVGTWVWERIGGAPYGAWFGNVPPGASVTIADVVSGNSKIYMGLISPVPDADSMIVGTTTGYLWLTNDHIYLANGQDAGSGKIWKFEHDFTRVDSLTGGKIGSPKAVWFDTLTSYIYWTDSGGKLKRAKFDGTADGSDLDSCFTSGSSTNQLSSPKGIIGYSAGGTYLGTITNDDTVYVSTIGDSITSVFSVGNNLVYTANSEIKGILVDSLDSWNILVKDKSQVYSVVTVDTINNVKRIAFGLPDGSKMSVSSGYKKGSELLNRSIGRLVEAEKDSIFHIGFVSSSTDRSSGKILPLMQSNMQRIELVASDYAQHNYYNTSYDRWEELDLVISDGDYTYPNDSLRNALIVNNMPLLVLAPATSGDSYCPDDGYFNSYEEDSLFYWIDSFDSIYVRASHPILDSLSISLGPIVLFNDPPSDDPAYQILTKSYVLTDTSNVKVLIKSEITDSVKYRLSLISQDDDFNIMLARTDRYWVYLNMHYVYGLPPYVDSFNPFPIFYESWLSTYLTKTYYDLLTESLYYILSGSAVLPPSDVTVTQHTADSLVVTWTDNSDNEAGFNIYLTQGGSYAGEAITIATVAADVDSTVIGIFWPPSSLWYLDVGAYSTIGGARSGSPDSAYVLPAQPARPIVYALSDTSINVLLNGYLWYDLFNDTTLASNPQWYQPYGKWNVERGYNRLRSWNVLDSTTLNVDLDSDNLTFDGVDDYAYHADTDSLDVGTEDYLISFWFKRATFGTPQRIINKRNGITFFDAMFDTDNKLYFTLCDGTFPAHFGTVGSSTIFNDGEWHHCIGIMDRDSSGYIFTDSTYDNSSSISTGNYDVSNTGSFYLSTYNGSIQFFNGQLSDLRFMKFGTDGLTITGTYGTNDLLITVGVDTIYCQATSDGLVKHLYSNPTETLNQTDYRWLYNAQQTPVSTNGTNWTDSNSDGLADNYGYENGSESGLAPTLQIGNGTHGFSGRYQRLIATGNGRYGMDLIAPFFPDSTYYYISFKYRATKSIEVAWKTFPANTGVPSSVYHVRKGALDSTFYVAWGENYVVGDSLEIDDLVIRKVGEVGWWPLTETDYPDTLIDYTSNNLDLITSGDLVASSGISATRANVISSELTDNKDVEYSLKFHLNDSLRLNQQWVKFYFISNDSIGTDDGYYVYADSNDFEVRKQTNGLDISTLVDTTYTGNYKWRTLKIVQDFSCTPVDTTYTYSFYLDNNLMGTMTDSTYTTLNWWVMQSSHRRQWWDSVWLMNNTPGANDSAFTQYAIIDSTSGYYLQTNHTMGSTPVWKSYESWGGEDGYYIKMSPFSTKKIRVIARPKQ